MAARTITLTLQLNNQVSQQLNAMTTGITRWRDNVTKSNNVVVNSLAKTFRELARLRTAFFILTTFLGLRPVFRYLEHLAQQSAGVSLSLQIMKDKFDIIEGLIVDELKPVFEDFLQVFADLKLELLLLAAENAHTIATIIRTFAHAIKFVAAFGKAIFSVKDALVNLWNVVENIGRGVEIVILTAAEAASKLVETILESTIGNFLKFYSTLERHNQEFIEDLGIPVKGLQEFLGKFSIGVADVTKALNKAKNEYGAAAEEIKKKGSEGWKGIADAFTDALTLDPIVERFLEQLEKVAPAVVTTIRRIMREGGSEALNNVDLAFKGIEDAFLAKEGRMRQIGEELGRALRQGMETFMSDTFVQLMDDRFSKFRDIVTSFLKSIQRAIADFMAKKVVGDFINWLAGSVIMSGAKSLLGGTSAGGGPSVITDEFGNSTPVQTYQHGGVTKHEGLAYLHKGEAVVPLQGGKIPVQSKGSTGNVVNVTFAPQVIDGPSFGQWLEKNKERIKRIMTEAATGGDMSVRQAFKLT